MDPNFFGLSGHPFARTESADAPCLAEEHLALSAELNAGLKAPHGITLLIGEAGAGKTTFVRNFLAQLPDSFVVAYLPTAGPGLRHLLTEIVEQLGGTVAAGGQEQALIDTLRALAKARAEHDRATLVVIDDAHELPAKTIERLGKLFGPDAADPSRLHVTLVGRPELLDRMNAANDRSILKHLVQVCRMDAIGPEDAFRYVADRVQRVGGLVDRLFSEDALRLIVQRANGNPARIDQLCSAALERAEGRGMVSVDAAAVEAASGDPDAATEATALSNEPETPTYFFNEDDGDQRAVDGTRGVPVDSRALPREDTAVAVPASRQRLGYWAVGAIAVAVAVAWFMTGGELPIASNPPSAVVDTPVQTATRTKSDPAGEESLAVPKLVVKRGGKAATERSADAVPAPPGAEKPGEVVDAPMAQATPETAPERPRFPAPPPPAAEAPTQQPTDQPAKTPPDVVASAPATAAPAPEKPAEKPVVPAPVTPTAEAPKAPLPAPAATATAPTPAAKTETSSQAPPPASPAVPQPATTDTPLAPTRPAAAAKPTVAPPVPAQTATAKVAKPTAATPASAGRFTVQLGAFSSRVNAETLLAKARSAASDGRIVASSAGGKSVFRVVTGSFATQAEANAHAAALKKSGHTGFVKQLD